MVPILSSIKTFLGKYHAELEYSALSSKYSRTGISKLFSQRFYIQENSPKITVDPAMDGMSLSMHGNEIFISKKLYNNKYFTIKSPASETSIKITKEAYDREIIPSMAYLICKNQCVITISGDLGEPIYVTFKSDFETFYNSVLFLDIPSGVNVEIVEEHQSRSALNTAIAYVVRPYSTLNLFTFYQNNNLATSSCLRTVVVENDATYNHTLYGKGSACIIDENRWCLSDNAIAKSSNYVKSNSHNFHSIFTMISYGNDDHNISINQKHVLDSKGSISFITDLPKGSKYTENVFINSIDIDALEKDTDTVDIFFNDDMFNNTPYSTLGSLRFYNNKLKFQEV